MKLCGAPAVLLALGLSACSPALGTVGTWSNDRTTLPYSIAGTSSVTTSDGKVVFLGGFDLRTGQPLDQVLVFDPSDNRLSQGAAMPVQDPGYTAVALANGSVLIAGGGGPDARPDSAFLATTWLYNPRLDTWKKAGNLNVPRTGATAVLLTSGRVMIAGGSVPLKTPVQNPDGSVDLFGLTSSVEIFTPETGAWDVVGSMHVARGGMALVALPNGGALAAGGCSFVSPGIPSGAALDSAELFDAVSGTWSATARMPDPRCGTHGLRLRDGRVLLTGAGLSDLQPGAITRAVIYDGDKGVWVAAGTTVAGGSAPILLRDGRVFQAAVQVGSPQGQVRPLVVGGQVFDPSSGDWSFVTSDSVLVSSRSGPQETLTVVGAPSGAVAVLLGTSGLALSFDPAGVPPPVLILDSSRLTIVVGALGGALLAWLAIEYLRARRRGRT